MSDTPRVDAFVAAQKSWQDVHWVEFAQQLERELAAAKQENAELRAGLVTLPAGIWDVEAMEAERKDA